MQKHRLLVADDHPAFLKKLVLLLTTKFEVVATAADGNAVLDLIRRYAPDLVILDLDMPLVAPPPPRPGQ